MKRIILSIRNVLVQEAIEKSLQESGAFLVETSDSQSPLEVIKKCNAFLTNILLMDVTRSSDGNFDNRLKIINSLNKNIKIALLCDSISDPEIAHMVKKAKEDNLIDAFFYETVNLSYLSAVLETL